MSLACVELFAGGGGASCGLRAAGFKSVCQVEWEPDACATLRAAGFDDVHEGDVREVVERVTGDDPVVEAKGRRRLTSEECALLQGFPPDYPWQGTSTSQAGGERRTTGSCSDTWANGSFPIASGERGAGCFRNRAMA